LSELRTLSTLKNAIKECLRHLSEDDTSTQEQAAD
jgi:hypothetical protein